MVKHLVPEERIRLLELAVESGAPLYEAVGVAQQFENYVLGKPVTKTRISDIDTEMFPVERSH